MTRKRIIRQQIKLTISLALWRVLAQVKYSKYHFVVLLQVHLPVSLTVSGIPPLYSCTCHNVELILMVSILWNHGVSHLVLFGLYGGWKLCKSETSLVLDLLFDNFFTV